LASLQLGVRLNFFEYSKNNYSRQDFLRDLDKISLSTPYQTFINKNPIDYLNAISHL
jgi:hypothetical protein